MMRSMFSGVSGLRVHQTKMDVIANNISNVNTVGFKSSRVTFSEVFSQTVAGASAASEETGRAGTNAMQVGLGASVATIDKNMNTGAAQRTDRALDVMVEGDGFFIVSDATGTYFTRAGNFDIDVNGNIHMNGMQVMGWDTRYNAESMSYEVASGQVTPLTIDGEKKLASPSETTQIVMDGNLNAAEQTDTIRNGTYEFYDSLGNIYQTNVTYEYVTLDGDAGSEWQMSIGPDMWLSSDPDTVFQMDQNNADAQTFTLEFDANGKLQNVVPAATDVPDGAGDATSAEGTTTGFFLIDPAAGTVNPGAIFGDGTGTENVLTDVDGAAAATGGYILINMDTVTQWGEDKSDISVFKFDGNKPGELTGYSIGTDGIVTGVYSNGDTRALFQIPTAVFDNPAGLESIGGNMFAQTANSGLFDGQGSVGVLRGGVLEMSNVDLSGEFTDMILTQRGFQANSKTITTSDELLQELINLKR